MTDEEVRRIIDEVLDKEAYSIYTTDVFRIIERINRQQCTDNTDTAINT
jgi:hypothetical protein